MSTSSAHQEDGPLPFKPGETGPKLGDKPGLYKCTNCRRDKPMSDYLGTAKPYTKTCHVCRHKAHPGTLTKTVPKKKSPAKEKADQLKARLQPFQAKHYLETFGETMPAGSPKPPVPTPPATLPALSPPASSSVSFQTAGSPSLSPNDSADTMAATETLPATAFHPSYYPAEYNANTFPNCLLTANVARAAGMMPHGPLSPTLETLGYMLKSGGSAYSGAASKKYAEFIVAVAKANAAFLRRVERMMASVASDEVMQAPGTLKIIKPYVDGSSVGSSEEERTDFWEIGGLYSPLRQNGGRLEDGDVGYAFGEEVDLGGNFGSTLGEELDLGGSWDVGSLPGNEQSSAETWLGGSQPTPGAQMEHDDSWMQDVGEWAVSPTRVMAGSKHVQQEGMGLEGYVDDEDFLLREALAEFLGS